MSLSYLCYVIAFFLVILAVLSLLGLFLVGDAFGLLVAAVLVALVGWLIGGRVARL